MAKREPEMVTVKVMGCESGRLYDSFEYPKHKIGTRDWGRLKQAYAAHSVAKFLIVEGLVCCRLPSDELRVFIEQHAPTHLVDRLLAADWSPGSMFRLAFELGRIREATVSLRLRDRVERLIDEWSDHGDLEHELCDYVGELKAALSAGKEC